MDTTPVRLIRHRPYLHWLASDTSQELGSSLQFFLIPILVAIITGDAAAAGTVAAVGLVGRVATTLFGGVLADRHDLRRMMVIGGLAAGVIAGGMAIAVTAEWGLIVLGTLNLAAGVRSGLTGGASNAALKQVVPGQQLPTASSANQARDAVVGMAGPPIGGLLVGISPLVALLVTSASYFSSGIAALFMRGDFTPDRTNQSGNLLGEMSEGLRWLWGRRELRTILLVALFLNLGLNTVIATLMYHYATAGEDPARIGLISLAMGVGMLAGAAVAAPLVQRFPSGRLALIGMSSVAIAALLLPFSPSLWWTLVILAVGILGAPMANAAVLSYFMHTVPRNVLGRATGALEFISGGATPLAPVIAGWGLALVGVQPTMITAAVIILGALVFLARDRQLRALPKPSEWDEAETVED